MSDRKKYYLVTLFKNGATKNTAMFRIDEPDFTVERVRGKEL
jgi:hypothetical protein